MNQISWKLDTLREKDIEDLQREISKIPPSEQQRLLHQAVHEIFLRSADNSILIKNLDVIQILLAGISVLLSEEEAVTSFLALLEFSKLETDDELKEHAITISALLLNRMRHARAHIPDRAMTLLGLLEGSPVVEATVAAMKTRIQDALRKSKEIYATRRFDIPDLDLELASKNVRTDIFGDWYQDPWAWPEIEWLGSEGSELTWKALKTHECGWTVPLDVKKRDGGMRPGLLINPCDRVAYQALVDDLSVEAAGELPSWVYGWRLSRSGRRKARYASNRGEWRHFSNNVSSLSKSYRFTAHIDIRSFFSSVSIDGLLTQIARRYRNAGVIDRLEAFLRKWNDQPNGLGIPQRSLASSILANVVLRPLDNYLDKLSRSRGLNRIKVSRWLDDIWVHSDSDTNLYDIVSEVGAILAQSRLSLNTAKTEVFEGRDDSRIIRVEDIYSQESGNQNRESLDSLLKETEGVPSFRIGWATSIMLSRHDFQQVERINPSHFSQLIPYSSQLAKLFKVSGVWRKFLDKYIDFANEHVADHDLPVVSWGEMFPNAAHTALAKVHDLYYDRLTSGKQRLLSPLAAQKLTAWSASGALAPDLISNILQDAGGSDDFLRTRGICFAMMHESIFRDKIGKSLREAGDETTWLYFNHLGTHAPKLSPRFSEED